LSCLTTLTGGCHMHEGGGTGRSVVSRDR
jgi:hypothetical protein